MTHDEELSYLIESYFAGLADERSHWWMLSIFEGNVRKILGDIEDMRAEKITLKEWLRRLRHFKFSVRMSYEEFRTIMKMHEAPALYDRDASEEVKP